MDEQEFSRLEQLLQDTLEVAEQNNKLLHSIQRTARWSFWGRLLLWIAVLILPLFFIKPLLQAVLPVEYTSLGAHGAFGLPTADQVKEILSAYKASTSAPQ